MTTTATLNVQTPGCWETFSASASQTASWLGHQISALGQGLKAGAMKVAAYASDLFSNLSTTAMQFFAYAKGYVAANKREVGMAAAAAAITAGIALLFARCTGCCNKPATTPAPTTTAASTTTTTASATTPATGSAPAGVTVSTTTAAPLKV